MSVDRMEGHKRICIVDVDLVYASSDGCIETRGIRMHGGPTKGRAPETSPQLEGKHGQRHYTLEISLDSCSTSHLSRPSDILSHCSSHIDNPLHFRIACSADMFYSHEGELAAAPLTRSRRVGVALRSPSSLMLTPLQSSQAVNMASRRSGLLPHSAPSPPSSASRARPSWAWTSTRLVRPSSSQRHQWR
jgi:hypothetical protein